MPAGRPTDYNLELAKDICDQISNNGISLKALCRKNPIWPHTDTIYRWLRAHDEFHVMYAKAKKNQVMALVDDILEISDDSSQDETENSNGDTVFNSEYVARCRLRVDSRKWIASKLVPRLYGDNMVARELSDEMDDLKKEFKKGIKHGK